MEKLVTMDDELSTVISANMLIFLILHRFVHLINSDSLALFFYQMNVKKFMWTKIGRAHV